MPQFRDAHPTEAESIATLVNATHSGPEAALGWTPETHLHAGPRTSVMEVSEVLRDPAQRVIVGLDPDLCGSVLIGADGSLGMLAVRPLRQAQGLGRALLAHAEGRAVALWGCGHLTLTAISLQEALIALYERRGYLRTGRRIAFPHEEQPGALRRDYDLVELRKSLAPA